jgi:hypothetical protein
MVSGVGEEDTFATSCTLNTGRQTPVAGKYVSSNKCVWVRNRVRACMQASTHMQVHMYVSAWKRMVIITW